MPITDNQTSVHEYAMSRLGVNLGKNIDELNPEECLQSQNMVWRNGMVKRGGAALVSSNEVVASKPITGVHRFYKGDGTTQTLAACDTVIKYLSGATWTSAITGLTSNLPTSFATWGALNKVYICNGTDAMRSWSGSAAATITIADGVPTQAMPYQDRLLTIIGGTLTWSASFDDTGANWGTASNIGVKPDTVLYGMCVHSDTKVSAGYQAKILLAGANGMYIFYGSDLRWPFTTGNYTIFPLPVVGCNAPKTMCWTPAGTMWLGIDKQVYLLPFDGNMPVPVGQKIRSNLPGVSGIETIPSAQMSKASAIYHDGYYKLSVPGASQSNNTAQWWLDITRVYSTEDNQFGPWYGPMTGQTVSCFATQNGTGDGGELLGGEATAKGYVYYLHSGSYYGDINPSTGGAQSIPILWQTFYNPLGNTYLPKDIHRVELEMLNVLGTVNISYYDITGAAKTGDIVTLSGSGAYWGVDYWGIDNWSSSAPTRITQPVDPSIYVRRLSLVIQQNISNDTFQIYGLRAEVKEQSQIFG